MKLTKAQREMLAECLKHDVGGGYTMHDGIMASVATRLATKGLVTLPAGHGYYFSPRLKVRITPAGRAALASINGGRQT